MATLPDPSAMQRQAPRPAGGVAQYRGDIVGEASMQAAQSRAQLGADISKMAQVEMNRLDASRVEQATTELRQKRFEMTAGDDGYAKQKGANVVYAPKEGKPFLDTYRERFDTTAAEIGAQMSPRQREMFDQQVNREKLSFQSDLMAHSMRESEKFHAEAKEGRINLEMQLGTTNWNNDLKRQESLDAINKTYDDMILVDGHAADNVNALRAVQVSKFHTNVMENAIAAENPEYASAYFEQHKDEILDADQVGAKVNEQKDVKLAMQTGAEVFATLAPRGNETGDTEAMYAELDKRLEGKSPDVIKAARAELKDRIQVRRDSLNQRDAEVYRMVLDGKGIGEIRRTPAFARLSLADQNKVIEQTKSKGDEVSYGKLSTYYKLRNEPGKLASMTEDEIVLFGQKNNLGKSMTNNLLAMNSELKTKPQAVIEATADKTDLDYSYRAATGKDPKGDEYNAAQHYIENRIDAVQREQGRRLTRPEKAQLINEAFKTIPVEGRWFGTNEKKRYEATPEDIAKIAVPQGEKANIISALKANGVANPTEANIKAYYFLQNR